MKQNLGDYIKQLESQTTKQFMIPRIPIVIRLDGKSFHTFTKGLKRPYDERLSQLMVDTTKYVMKQTNPVFAYTQSDEITLVYYNENIESDIIYGGKLHKLTSIIPGFATAFFNKKLGEYIPEKKDDMIVFDGRVFNTPSLLDAANTVLWREIDATKNSITMASLSVYSHKEIDGKNSSQKQEMLFEKGINWNDYPNFFKKGTYLKRKLNTETNRSEIVDST
jgi:tRNA(His) guanylyltransferase